jgi:peptide/nickel transport system substrate-binding protein
MLARLNLDVTVDTMPVAVYYGRARKKEFTMPQIGWATLTGEASIIARSMLVSGARNNYGSYSNPKVDALIKKAWATVDTPTREALLREAIRTAWVEDVAGIPTHFQVNTWAARKGLRVVPNTHGLLEAEWVVKE